MPSRAAHLERQAPQPAAAVNTAARARRLTHAVKLFDALETRIGVSPHPHHRPAAKAKKSPAKPASAKKSPKKWQAASLCSSYVILTNAFTSRPAPKKATPKKPAAKSPKKPARARVDLDLSSRRRRSLYAGREEVSSQARREEVRTGVEPDETPASLVPTQVAREEGRVAEEAGRQEESREAGLEGEEPRQKEDGRQEVSGEEAGREEVPGEAIHAQQEEVETLCRVEPPSLRRIP